MAEASIPRKLYGILAAVEVPADIQKKVLRKGLYLMLGAAGIDIGTLPRLGVVA